MTDIPSKEGPNPDLTPRDPLERHIGRRVYEARLFRNKSQKWLADAVSVSFQQIQNYETGANRVSASRLWRISRCLRIPVAYFYEGFFDAPDLAEDLKLAECEDRPVLSDAALRAAYLIDRIRNEAVRKDICKMAAVLAEDAGG
ncbi:MAG: helix-turn-helix transcriptional regulator [Pseudomonadota bacterium]